MLKFLKRIFGRDNSVMVQAMQNGAVIVDVRTPAEYKQGHIDGSKNIPLDVIKSKVETIRNWKNPIVTVCRSGSRSSMAKGILVSACTRQHQSKL
jgi:rhodanese-related sulfurtransferase